MNINYRKKLIDLSYHYKGDYLKLKIASADIDNCEVDGDKNIDISCSTLVYKDEHYPDYFLNLDNPPLVLYYYGNKHLLKMKNRFAVVGTRKPSSSGVKVINGILDYVLEHYKKAGESFVLVNGMANGIDLLAARMAIKYNLPIIMYLGSGIDCVYPANAMDVYDYCKRGMGLVLSEYPNDVLPNSKHFPFRNRLIAATSTSVFVPEATIPSGTYSTINHALNLGLEIATCPISFDVKNSLNNELIKDGAQPITSGKELVEFIDNSKISFFI